jgi:S-DNA-T family DNA segregation ATPase FtsK/SpoIIIE
VVETIPGKNYDGARAAQRQAADRCGSSEILGSQVYNEATSLLTMGLGKDIVGNPVVADLAQDAAPAGGRHDRLGQVGGHQRDDPVACCTRPRPRDVRLILIDPKMLEMSVYEGIPHLLAPVVTDMQQAAQRAELVRRRDGAALQADEQAGRAQPGGLQHARSTRRRRAASCIAEPVLA